MPESPRLTRDLVVAAYELLLGRPPESEAAIQSQLATGETDAAGLGLRFIRSPEFRQRFAALTADLPIAGKAQRQQPLFLGDRVLAETWRGESIFLAPQDLDLTPTLLKQGRWKPRVEATLAGLVRRGQWVADVGANVGPFTLALADAVGPQGLVDCFEPNPQLARLLAATLHVNGLGGHVTLHAQAALDRSGSAGFGVVPDRAASGALLPASPRHIERMSVPAIRLDEALAQCPALDLLRMDIGGCEPLALRGAASLIGRSAELMILTAWCMGAMRGQADVAALLTWLAELKFQAWWLNAAAELEPVKLDALLAMPDGEVLFSRQSPG
jgi:FkbM family methyltransferase